MELSFASAALRRICEDPVAAAKALPEEVVAALQDRLADLEAADSMSDVVVGGPSVDRRPPGGITYELPGGFALKCAGGYKGPPLSEDGLVATARMRRVRIVGIDAIGGSS